MCFVIHFNHEKIKKAEKDIVCYKLIHKKGRFYKSIYQGFIYEPGECYYENNMKKNYMNCIHEGFHSYKTYSKAEHENNIFGVEIIRCIIPEGAKYYYNPEYKEYVSNYLIIGKKPINGKNIRKTSKRRS